MVLPGTISVTPIDHHERVAMRQDLQDLGDLNA
jgi:hypothetical protein